MSRLWKFYCLIAYSVAIGQVWVISIARGEYLCAGIIIIAGCVLAEPITKGE